MRTDDGRIDHLQRGVRHSASREPFQDHVPDATVGPPPKLPKDRIPVAEALRQVAPWCAGSHQPKHRVEHAAMIAWRPAAAAMDQERFEVRPLIVGHQSANQGCPPQRAALNQFAILASIGLSTRPSEPTFWNAWKAYKDAAPLVTATILILANARIVFTDEYVAAFRTHDDAEPIEPARLTPFHMAMLLPDLVLAVGRSFEEFALTIGGRPDAGLDPEALWRIPEDINVAPVPPPPRNIRPVDKRFLDARRAGNRGRRNKLQTERLLSRPL